MGVVEVGVAVTVGVNVTVGVGVRVGGGVSVGVGVSGIEVAVGGIGTGVGVSTFVGVFIRVAVAAGVTEGLGVAVLVGATTIGEDVGIDLAGSDCTLAPTVASISGKACGWSHPTITKRTNAMRTIFFMGTYSPLLPKRGLCR